jgi:hypothetical protein
MIELNFIARLTLGKDLSQSEGRLLVEALTKDLSSKHFLSIAVSEGSMEDGIFLARLTIKIKELGLTTKEHLLQRLNGLEQGDLAAKLKKLALAGIASEIALDIRLNSVKHEDRESLDATGEERELFSLSFSLAASRSSSHRFFDSMRLRAIKLHLASLLAAASLINACGVDEKLLHSINGKDGKKLHIDPEFISYVHLYESIQGASLEKSSISFSDLNNEIAIKYGKERLGYCDGDGNITIDKTIWGKIKEGQKEYLILHELGHCEGDLRHNNSVKTAEDGCMPSSIMYPFVMHESTYQRHRAEYLSELQFEITIQRESLYPTQGESPLKYCSNMLEKQY